MPHSPTLLPPQPTGPHAPASRAFLCPQSAITPKKKKNFLAALGVEQYDVAAPLRCSAAARATIPSLRNSIPLLHFALLRRYLPTSNSTCVYTVLSTHYHKRVTTCSYTHSVHTTHAPGLILVPRMLRPGAYCTSKGKGNLLSLRSAFPLASRARYKGKGIMLRCAYL